VSHKELTHSGDGARLGNSRSWRANSDTSKRFWLLMIANFGFGYGIYIFQSWFYHELG